MLRFVAALALSCSLASVASAQTLTIELDAEVDASVGVEVDASPPVAAPSGAVVLVRPEGDARVRLPAEAPRPVYQSPAPSAPVEQDPDIEGWGGLMLVVEGFDLGQMDLTLTDPEIEALDGLSLGSEWAGRAGLGETITGGVGVHVGMRAAGFFRGPELRLFFGGGDIDGPYAPVQVPGMAVALRSLFYFRAELALGLQVPIGPVTPYVVAIGSAGVAFVDVAVQDSRLGGLGSETLDAGLFGLGLEAGVDVEVDRGVQLGFAFRGSFVGTPSLGGAFRVSFGGE